MYRCLIRNLFFIFLLLRIYIEIVIKEYIEIGIKEIYRDSYLMTISHVRYIQ